MRTVPSHVVALTAEMKEILADCVRLTGMRQNELGRRSKTEQSWLSRILRGSRENVDGDMIDRVVEVVASTIEAQGPEAMKKATLLRQVFSKGAAVGSVKSAMREMVITGLVTCGLNVSREQAEEYYDLPGLEARLANTLSVLLATQAAIKASKGDAVE